MNPVEVFADLSRVCRYTESGWTLPRTSLSCSGARGH